MSDSNKHAGVTRRKKGDKKRGTTLDPELEEFARSDEKKWRRKSTRRAGLQDPREHFIIRGVANRDSRTAIDSYTERLTDEATSPEHRKRWLSDVVRLRLWRGRNYTGFESYVTDVLHQDFATMEREAEEGARALGVTLDPIPDPTAAIWIRAAVAAAEIDKPLFIGFSEGRLTFEVDTDTAPQVLRSVGQRLAPLAKDREPDGDGLPPRPREQAAPRRQPHGSARNDRHEKKHQRRERRRGQSQDDEKRGPDDA